MTMENLKFIYNDRIRRHDARWCGVDFTIQKYDGGFYIVEIDDAETFEQFLEARFHNLCAAIVFCENWKHAAIHGVLP
jgi:hypothetical protein